MGWTANRTWVTAETVTAAIMNQYIRDNLDETCPATATTAGDLIYADAANSMGSRLGIGASGTMMVSDGSGPVWRVPDGDDRSDSTTGTTDVYKGLGGAFWYNDADPVQVILATDTKAAVWWSANLANSTVGAITLVSYAVSNATDAPASDARSVSYEASVANDLAQFGSMFFHEGLTPGNNTFTLFGRVTSGTGTIGNPRIMVIPL